MSERTAELEALAARMIEQRKRLRGPHGTPEWAPEIPEIYARPFSIADKAEVQRWIGADDPQGWVELVIRFARDADGEKIFAHRADGAWLRHASARTVARVGNWIMGLEVGGAAVCPHCGEPLDAAGGGAPDPT